MVWDPYLIGERYASTRREDPQLAVAIVGALGASRTVLNVGAGAGSYEPRDRHVLAFEPSDVMAAQRPDGAAPALRLGAGPLPLRDYLPEAAAMDRALFPSIEELTGWLDGTVTVAPVLTARDTPDWTIASFWAHPQQVLDDTARQGTSAFALMQPDVVNRVVGALAADLADGSWDRRYGHLHDLASFDAGMRLVVATP